MTKKPRGTAKVIEAVQTRCGKESEKLGKLIIENRKTLRNKKQSATTNCNNFAALQLGSFYGY
uniref:Uncharacterized protein n=1 Tax=Ditylenchus dipsaci TaxID=166011 RepID=A0A915DUS0_9BILA